MDREEAGQEILDHQFKDIPLNKEQEESIKRMLSEAYDNGLKLMENNKNLREIHINNLMIVPTFVGSVLLFNSASTPAFAAAGEVFSAYPQDLSFSIHLMHPTTGFLRQKYSKEK
jgi:hypothetical protein